MIRSKAFMPAYSRLTSSIRAMTAGICIASAPAVVNAADEPVSPPAYNLSRQYSASFENADIKEFINTVSRNLNRTIIISPEVRGTITVRSYDTLNEEQYYQFFLSVLDVYGFAAISEQNGVIKVIQEKDSKTSAIPVGDPGSNSKGDEVETWVVPVKNVPVRELSPLLRQMITSTGSVVHYDPSNILLMTGRANNLQRLAEVVRRVDKAGLESTRIVALKHASASEMAHILQTIYSGKGRKRPGSNPPIIIGNESKNQLILSGSPEMLLRMTALAEQLDAEQESTGNTRVFYLNYAKAKDLKPVLESVGKSVQNEKSAAATRASAPGLQNFSIEIHEGTNSLIVSAQPDVMRSIEGVIKQLDIRRAQVIVEAMIVEVSEGNAASLGFQFANEDGSTMMQFNNFGAPIGELIYANREAEDKKGTVIDDNGEVHETTESGNLEPLASVLSKISGAAVSISAGDFTAFLQAVATDQNSNVLARPSLMTLDNRKATFMVGEDVPLLTGSQASSNGNSNPYQTVERHKVGTMLELTPQINEGDSVILDIKQTTSGLNGTTDVDVKISEREITTAVQVKSGQIIALGGMIQEQVNDSVSKIPLLGDIPFIGQLFRSTNSVKSKTNLMVFIRPTIVRDDESLTSIAGRKYTLMRAAQLDKRSEGIPLLPEAETPLLPEDPSDAEAWFNTARKKMGSDSLQQANERMNSIGDKEEQPIMGTNEDSANDTSAAQ